MTTPSTTDLGAEAERQYAAKARQQLGRVGLSAKNIERFLSEIVEDDLHAKTILSLALGTLGVLHAASLCIHVVGRAMAWARGAEAMARAMSCAAIVFPENPYPPIMYGPVPGAILSPSQIHGIGPCSAKMSEGPTCSMVRAVVALGSLRACNSESTYSRAAGNPLSFLPLTSAPLNTICRASLNASAALFPRHFSRSSLQNHW